MTAAVTQIAATPRHVAPRSRRRFHKDDMAWLAGTAFGSAVLVALLQVTALRGALGAFVIWYALFVVSYWATTRHYRGSTIAADRVATLVVYSFAAFTFIPLVIIIVFVIGKGISALSPNFFTKTLETVGPSDPATSGGAKNAIIGTLEQVAVATIICVPLGILTAVYLSEVRGRLERPTRFFVDAMSGIPSIVAGLFVFTIWVVQMKKGFSGFAAAIALAILMLPIVTRTSEEMLKLVPGGLRESSLALGATEWKTLWKVTLPVARSGIITAVLLGIARVVGETAPLLMTAFGTDSVNTNVGHGPQSALPLFVYQQIRQPLQTQVARAWTGALVLILTVLILFTLARLVAVVTRRNVKSLWSRRRSTAPLPTSVDSPPTPPATSAPG